MQIRKIKYSSNLLVIIIIMFCILSVINFLSATKFNRLDLTKNKEYTISESTKKVLRSLDDIATIKVYFSKELPSYIVNLSSQVKDMLSEYKAYAKGNLNISFIDPGDDEKMQNELRFMGIPQVQLQVVNKDKAEVMKAYLGMAIMYGDKKEVIPVVQSASNLEYDLTSAIVKVTNPEEKTVAFLTGNEEKDMEKDYSQIKTELQKQYTITTAETKKGLKIPQNVNTLIVAGPKNLTDRDKYEIDQFLMNGGKIIFMIDPISREEKGLQASPAVSNIQDLLANYGVKLNQDLVLDRSNANAGFSSGFISYSLPYPFWPKLVKQFLAPDNPIISGLESIVLPWTSSMEILQDKVKDIKIVELAKSTPYAWNMQGNFDLNPQQQFGMSQGEKKQYTLALILTGKFKSFFTGKEVPKPTEEANKDEAPPKEETRETIAESQKPSQIIVIGNSDFPANNFISQFPSNALFFLNMVDWLTLGEQLINIRARGMSDRPLKEDITDKEKDTIKFLNMFGVPILVIIFGIIVFILRKNKKRKLQLAS
jgi:ABC-2 type transport system permease protein